ncbi:MAG: glycoside hydrolase family 2 protein [Clostridia bacterium]|nr:glycoside hydrolase family 2 protein [Clostridia bacterium]
MKQLLNDGWIMIDGAQRYTCAVPCSVYDTLLKNDVMADPYAGENEYISTPICDRDFAFERVFSLDGKALAMDWLLLSLDGVDTLADVFLNGQLLGHCDNMHRQWEFDIKDAAQAGENLLRLELHSPTRYIAQKQKERPLWGVESTMAGYPWLRKAHCMFGWDWGPQLPDMGIWRDVAIKGYTGGRILEVYYTQRHSEGRAVLSCRAAFDIRTPGAEAILTVTAPDGQTFTAPIVDGEAEIVIENPRLWWVRGLGGQPLYTCSVTLRADGKVLDSHMRRIGLRTLTISQQPDQWGKAFCFINNGVKVFAMGANYIPEDQLIPRCTPEHTARLLQACADANFNFIRVWGGGWYPSDGFYDWCDKNGLMVWQDFMFACSAYLLTPDFESTVRAEIRDNVLRLRNHASLAMWCGNNEIETAWAGWGLPADPQAKADYLRLFEEIIPGILAQHDPETFYWPSSPSSQGGFREPESNQAGDMHYWAVWHSFKPIEAFRKFHYRFCSEYGFESLPDVKTVRAFAGEGPLDLCSSVMEAHQKCVQGNEKIMFYLAQMVNYPYDFERLIYCSQLVQADCIRSNVEHMRRARGRCMGSAYWQVNDSNPVISWSSIDYFGRWKGLHYAARRFYAPILVSCDDGDPLHPALYVTNDTAKDRELTLICRLRDNAAKTLAEYAVPVHIAALSAAECLKLDLSEWLNTPEKKRTRYLEYALLDGDKTLSAGTTLFVRPKNFVFLPPAISCDVSDAGDAFALTFTAQNYAKSVCLSLEHADCVFSDNWFDIHGSLPVTVRLKKTGALAGLSAEEVRRQLKVTHY